MRSIPQALMWEMFSRGRWHILGFFVLGNLLPLLVYGALSPFEMDPNDSALLIMHLCFLPIVLFQFAVGIVAAQGSLSRLYTTPISTASLVAWHMFPGGVLLAIEVAVAAWTYNILFQAGWPIWGPALFAAAAWSSSQLMVSVSQRTMSSFCLAGTPCVLIFAWLRSRYGGWFSNATHYWSEVTPVETATLLGFVGLAYIVTVMAVTRDRCGEPMPSLGGWKWLMRTWDAMTADSETELRPFRSPAHAQFWYEWRLKGLALPSGVVIAMIVTGGVWLIRIAAGHAGDDILMQLHVGLLAGGGCLPLMAGVIGMMVGVASIDNTARHHHATIRDLAGGNSFEEMGHFLSTRPLTNQDFAKSALKIAIRSLLISWGLWATAFAGSLLLAVLTNQIPVPLFGPFGAWYLPLTLLGSWVAFTNLATIVLSGRGVKIIFVGVTALISYGAGMIVTKEVFSSEAQNKVFETLMWIGSIAIIGITLLAFRRAHRFSCLSLKSQCQAGFVGLGIVILAIALRPADLPVLAYPMILAFSSLVIMPLATTPLAIAWNRHR